MPRGKKFTGEQIIGKLREAEVGLAQGMTVPEPAMFSAFATLLTPLVVRGFARRSRKVPAA